MDQYRIATDAYEYAVTELERGVRERNTAAFDDLVRLTQNARRVSNDARENLKRHVADHGC